ncbi:hypothetical protein EAH81_27260, partial [Flavobacterium pectinovorum]
MKNRLLPLVFVLGCYSAYSQVGIGTLNPNASAQLDVVSKNKGILIPRVTLKSVTDMTSVVSDDGNYAESLLVYNIGTAITPGYYYWANNRWNRLITSGDAGGAAGLSGGIGIPGKDGVVAPDGTTSWINTNTGIIYVLDPISKEWVVATGVNGIPGVNGTPGTPGNPGTPGSITTLDAIIKDAQGNIYAYVGSENTVKGRDDAWAVGSPDWVKINGLNGAAGIPGVVGEPGTPGNPGASGSITTLDAIIKDAQGNIYAYVGSANTVKGRDDAWAQGSADWVKINGLNGAAGIPGVVGEPGTPGNPGASGSITTLDAIIKDAQGNIYAYVGSANTVKGRDDAWAVGSPDWVKISGLNGKDGKDGITGGTGVPGAKGDSNYPGDNVVMYINSDTGTIYVRDPKDETKWIPLTGETGMNGIPGVNGTPGTPGNPGASGSITTLDAIIKDAQGNIYAYVG